MCQPSEVVLSQHLKLRLASHNRTCHGHSTARLTCQVQLPTSNTRVSGGADQASQTKQLNTTASRVALRAVHTVGR